MENKRLAFVVLGGAVLGYAIAHARGYLRYLWHQPKQTIETKEEPEEEEELDDEEVLKRNLVQTEKEYRAQYEKLIHENKLVYIITSARLKHRLRLPGIINRVNEFLRMYSKHGNQDLRFMIHCTGFDVTFSYEVSKNLLQHRQQGFKVTSIVPYYAYSSGTEIALSCDEILANPFALFSPVDTVLDLDNSSISSYDVVDYQEKDLNRDTKSELVSFGNDNSNVVLPTRDLISVRTLELKRTIRDAESHLQNILKRMPPETPSSLQHELTRAHDHSWPWTAPEFSNIGVKHLIIQAVDPDYVCLLDLYLKYVEIGSLLEAKK
jgi:hypothetical protein